MKGCDITHSFYYLLPITIPKYSPSHFATGQQSVSQSVRPSWRRAAYVTHDRMSLCCQTVMGLVVMSVLYDERMRISIANRPVFVRCYFPEDKAVYNMYNL
jgi:hypothetical protein